MNLSQIEKLYDTKDPNNIVLANSMIISQLSDKNIFSLLSMCIVKHNEIFETYSDLKKAFENKIKEIGYPYSFSTITVTQIFSHMLNTSASKNVKQLKEVREYYINYIDSLIEQIGYKDENKKEIINEDSLTPF
jgi:hypothetical protein